MITIQTDNILDVSVSDGSSVIVHVREGHGMVRVDSDGTVRWISANPHTPVQRARWVPDETNDRRAATT